jgi:hypothetical protein
LNPLANLMQPDQILRIAGPILTDLAFRTITWAAPWAPAESEGRGGVLFKLIVAPVSTLWHSKKETQLDPLVITNCIALKPVFIACYLWCVTLYFQRAYPSNTTYDLLQPTATPFGVLQIGHHYTKTLITNKCTKTVLSSIVTHSYMFRPCRAIFRENLFVIVTLRLHFIVEWECSVDCVLEAWTLLCICWWLVFSYNIVHGHGTH